MDLIQVDKSIDDGNHKYKYILNIIDNFSKYIGSFLLETKKYKKVLYYINEFVVKNGKPQILKADNVKEFNNLFY